MMKNNELNQYKLRRFKELVKSDILNNEYVFKSFTVNVSSNPDTDHRTVNISLKSIDKDVAKFNGIIIVNNLDVNPSKYRFKVSMLPPNKEVSFVNKFDNTNIIVTLSKNELVYDSVITFNSRKDSIEFVRELLFALINMEYTIHKN
jgi:hypothetical protein